MSQTQLNNASQSEKTSQNGDQHEQQNELESSWIRQAADVCDRAAHGDLEARITNIEATGDLARIFHGINSMLDYTDAFVREAKASLMAAAKGDFHRRVVLRGMTGTFRQASDIINQASDDMKLKSDALKDAEQERLQMADDFESTIKEISTIVASAATQMCSTAQHLTETSKQTAQQSTEATDATGLVSENVSNVMNSTNHLSVAIREIEGKVSESAQVVMKAVGEADHAGEVIKKLEESSYSIDSVVRMISDIARQTNLLALNAAIEAARAGEAGRGFAIVASEVKELAQQTHTATDRVSDEIANIKSSSSDAENAISLFRETINKLNEVSDSISEAVSEQGNSMQEIGHNVDELSQRMEGVTGNVYHVNEMADKTSHAIEDLHSAAGELSTQSEKMSLAVDQFLVKIRKKTA